MEIHYDQTDAEFHNVPFGRTHKFKEKEWKSGSVMRSAGVIEEPDKKPIQAILDSIQRKDARESYEEFERRYGKGMLLLDRPTDPLIDSGTIEMLDRWKKGLPKFWTSKFFSKIYLRYVIPGREYDYYELYSARA
jgi:hypothetical protein